MADAALKRRLVIQFGGWLLFMMALMFVPAGTLDWPAAWVHLALSIGGGAAISLWLLRHDPGLLRERLGGLIQRQQPTADKLFILTLPFAYFGWMVLMALDARRWGWSQVPSWLAVVGAALVALCMYLSWLTFRANSFAAPVVKLQAERQQTVASTGPYAVVRHPLYAGALLYFVGLPLLLGSLCGLIAAPLLTAGLMLRIPIEERTLRDGLPGYTEYAARVRYRLVPGVW